MTAKLSSRTRPARPNRPTEWRDLGTTPNSTQISKWIPALRAALHRLAGMTILAVICLSFATPAFAIAPDEVLKDPKLEQRARAIGKELRCLVCQNESIDESDAPLARDLRLLVRQRLERGDSDDAVKQYVVARYGTYVLLKPPFEPATYLIWFGPLALLAAGGIAVGAYLRRAKPAAAPPLTDEERDRLKAMGEGE